LNIKGNPKLAIIKIGQNAASSLYVKMKLKSGEKIGIKVCCYEFYANEVSAIEKKILELNADISVNGIIIQLPIPLNLKYLLNMIEPKKDVDGLGVVAQGKLALNQEWLRPRTPFGIMYLLDFYNISVLGKDICVVGSSILVGQSLALMLLHAGATVSILNSNTKDIKSYIKNAKFIISATGKVGVITKDMVNADQTIIDVGISKVDGYIFGDVSHDVYETVKNHTPVPGGVGPMTVASLMHNVIKAYDMQN